MESICKESCIKGTIYEAMHVALSKNNDYLHYNNTVLSVIQ